MNTDRGSGKVRFVNKNKGHKPQMMRRMVENSIRLIPARCRITAHPVADGHADEHGGAGRTQHAEMISKRQNNTFFRRQADNTTDAAAHFPIYIKFESVRLELIFIKSGETRKKQDNYTICQMKCKGRTPMP